MSRSETVVVTVELWEELLQDTLSCLRVCNVGVLSPNIVDKQTVYLLSYNWCDSVQTF